MNDTFLMGVRRREASCFKAPKTDPIKTTGSLAIDFVHSKIRIVNIVNYSTIEQ